MHSLPCPFPSSGIVIAGFHGHPSDQVFDLARERRFAQPLTRDRLTESERDGGAGIGRQDVPHLVLAARAVLAVVGMHLYRQALGREDQLH